MANANNQSPLGFIKNQGQVVDENGVYREEVKFTVNNANSKLFFQKNKITYVIYEFYKEESEKSLEAKKKGNDQEAEMLSIRIKQQNIDFLFLNSNPNVTIEFKSKRNEYQNYYKGNVKISNIEIYDEVIYKNLYNNIDVLFKSDNGKLKYDIILHKGAKFSDIQFKYEGVDAIDFKNDKITFKTKIKDLIEHIPISFFKETGKQINVTYKQLNSDVFGFLKTKINLKTIR